MSLWAFLFFVMPVTLIALFVLVALLSVNPVLAILIVAAFVWLMRWSSKSAKENSTRRRAEWATEQAKDYIRITHGREPLDDDEVYRVARQRYFDPI